MSSKTSAWVSGVDDSMLDRESLLHLVGQLRERASSLLNALHTRNCELQESEQNVQELNSVNANLLSENLAFRTAAGIEPNETVISGDPKGSLLIQTTIGQRRRVWPIPQGDDE